MEVDTRLGGLAGVEGRRVPVDAADPDDDLAAGRRHDAGLDVDGHEDPLVPDEARVPRPPRREVDVGAREGGEPVGVDRLAELLAAELEGRHQTPSSLNVVTCLA